MKEVRLNYLDFLIMKSTCDYQVENKDIIHLLSFIPHFLWISVTRWWKYEPQSSFVLFCFLKEEWHTWLHFPFTSAKSESSFQSKNDNWAELYWWEALITMWFLTTLRNFITVRKSFVKSVVYNLFYSYITSYWKEARSCFFGYQWIKHFLNTLTSLSRQTFFHFFFVSIHSHTESTVYSLDQFNFKIFTHKKTLKNNKAYSLHCASYTLFLKCWWENSLLINRNM